MPGEAEGPQPQRPEVNLPKPTEVPYIVAVKALTRERMPQQADDFDNFFNAINGELMGNGESRGLFIWESKKYPGVKFLAGHVRITDKLISKLSDNIADTPSVQKERRITHMMRFLEPGWGRKGDGSGVSILDMAFSPALDMANSIATAKRNGETPPVGDIFLLGSPTGVCGESTVKFNTAVGDANSRGEGFDPFGEIYAEFMEEYLPTSPEELDRTRAVVEGVSKGGATAGRTFAHLPEYLKSKIETHEKGGKKYKKITRGVQLLLDNPAGTHGDNWPTRVGRTANMAGFVVEAGVRNFTSPIARVLNRTQPMFYKWLEQENGGPLTEEKRKIRDALAGLEVGTLMHGVRMNREERTYVRVSTPDTANSSFKAIRRGLSFDQKDHPRAIQDWVMSEGEVNIFPNSNKLHMWPWVRNIESGSWSRKMASIVGRESPKQQAA